MPNLLHLPSSTLVDKPVPKAAFFRHAPEGKRSPLQRALTEEFERITWLYKLTADTLHVADGKLVHEIAIFHCLMRVDSYDISTFVAMDKLLPRQTLFLIEHGGQFDLLMHHKTTAFASGAERWICGETERCEDVRVGEEPLLTIEGLNLDAIYYGLLSQVSGLHATDEKRYNGLVALRKEAVLLSRKIDGLKRRARREKQFNRQVELNRQIRQLKAKIDELQNQIK